MKCSIALAALCLAMVADAGMTTHLKLDLREGSVHLLRQGQSMAVECSPLFVANDADVDELTAAVLTNGVIWQTSHQPTNFTWSSEAQGMFVLTHEVRQNGELLGEPLVVTNVVCSIDEPLVLASADRPLFEQYQDTYDRYTTIEIAEGVTTIVDDCFKGCSGLQNITIPSTVTRIGRNAFSGCESIASVTLGRTDYIVKTPGFFEARFGGMSAFDDTRDIRANATGTKLSAEMLMANTIDEHTMYAYAAHMYFKAGVTYTFYTDFDDKASVKVDGQKIVTAANRECVKQSGTVSFATSGWRWIELRGWNNGGPGARNYGSNRGIEWWTSEDPTRRRFEDTGNGMLFRAEKQTDRLSEIFGDATAGIDLLVRAEVLLFRRTFGELAEVLHGLDAVLAIHASREIGEFSRGEANESECRRRDSATAGEGHGEVFAFGEFGIGGRRQLEDVLALKPDECQSIISERGAFEMDRELGLDARNTNMRGNEAFRETVEVFWRIGKGRDLR